MEREARRIDQIVRGLLDYARPVSARREPVDLNESVERVVEIFHQQGKLKGVELPPSSATISRPWSGVPHRVDQMFVNLIGNAIAAMDGVGRSPSSPAARRYQPKKRLPARRADDPPGIDYSHLRRLAHGSSRESRVLRANLSRRASWSSPTPARDPGGEHRLHLRALLHHQGGGGGDRAGPRHRRRTVEEMGGRIDVSSVEGGGATFHLYLPLREAGE
jgi:two-component system, NtrC family, sensor kinase